MEDFSNDLFSSFFDDPVLDEKSPLLDMELDSPTPGIQAEHSYSLSGDSAPQSPLVPIKMEDTTQGKEGWKDPGSVPAQKTQEGRKLLSDLQRILQSEAPRGSQRSRPQTPLRRLPPAFLFFLKSNLYGPFLKEFAADLGHGRAKGEGGPQTGSIPWELVRHADSQVPPHLLNQ